MKKIILYMCILLPLLYGAHFATNTGQYSVEDLVKIWKQSGPPVWHQLKLTQLKQISGYDVFMSGSPDDGDNFKIDSSRKYNPKFVSWALTTIVPKLISKEVRDVSQTNYDTNLRDITRIVALEYAYYQGYNEGCDDDDSLDDLWDEYIETNFQMGDAHKNEVQLEDVQGLIKTDDTLVHDSNPVDDVEELFWERRETDGTMDLFFEIIEEILEAYDNGFYEKLFCFTEDEEPDNGESETLDIYKDAVVSTIAGEKYGSKNRNAKNGKVDVAEFRYPQGIAIDVSGNIIVADYHSHQIRKIDTAGNVTTIAGSGLSGKANGVSSNASFKCPLGIAIDTEGIRYQKGTIIVADYNRHQILKIDPKGNVSTIAGSGAKRVAFKTFRNGSAEEAVFSHPSDVAIDKKGNIIVADTFNHQIRKIDKNGNVSTIAGGGGSDTRGFNDGKGIQEARFWEPYGIAIDKDGNIFVADKYNQRIRKIDVNGNVTTIREIGERVFLAPAGIAIDNQGDIIVADKFDHRIWKIDVKGNVNTIAGNGKKGFREGAALNAMLHWPTDIAIDKQGNIIVADTVNNRIRKIKIKK